MNCQDISQEATAHLHGELDTTREAEFQHHLDHCRECRLEVESLQSFRSQFFPASSSGKMRDEYWNQLVDKVMNDPEVPPLLRQNLSPSPVPSSRWRSWWGQVAAILLLAGGLAVAGTHLYQKWSSPLNSADRGIQEVERSPQLVREYRQFVVLVDPDDPQANLKLAQWCKEQSLLVQARDHLKKVINIEPQNPRAKELLEEIKM